MNCPYCGANYSETELQCPYCQGENKTEAERRQLLKLKRIEEEAESIKKLPKKILQKSTKRLFAAGGCIAGCIVLIMIILFGFGKITVVSDYQKQQNHIKKLSKYCDEQSYLEIRDYLIKYDLNQTSYVKYQEISDAYYAMFEMNEELEELKEQGANNIETAYFNVELCLYYGAETLSVCKNSMEDKAILGNEDILSSFYEEIAGKLEAEFKLTKEEIKSLSLNEADIIENLAEKVIERWENK